jgi:hypothetical protein
MNKEKLIYLAAPYSHKDQEVVDKRSQIIVEVTINLVEQGFKVISPIMYGEMLSAFVELDPEFDYWGDYCLGMLSGCDELWILKLEGWDVSKGVKSEMEFAEANGIPITFAEVEENVDDIADETKFKSFCQEPLISDLDTPAMQFWGRGSREVNLENEANKIVSDMMDMVKKDLGAVPATGEQPKNGESKGFAYGAKMCQDVMIDIETLGTTPGSVILSIAAVRFDMNTGEVSDYITMVIDIQSCLDIGMEVDGDTLMWWMNLDQGAREHLSGATVRIEDGLEALSRFLRDEDKVWGNSARFDFGLLADASTRLGFGLPWNFRNERDVRTLVSFKPEVKDEVVFEGDPHNPLDDCKHQINYCHLIWKFLNS